MNSARLTIGMIFLVMGIMPLRVHAQRDLIVELHAGGGITAVDVQKASGQTSEVGGEDYGMYQFMGRVFFAKLGPARVGVEVGYQYLYYYDAPYIGTLARDIDAMRYAAVFRFQGPGRIVAEAGAGVYSFEGGSVLSTLGGVGLDFSLTPKIAIPVRLRADVVFDDAITVPVGATLGIAIRL